MFEIFKVMGRELKEPDFTPIVDKAITLFAVYTGATLTFFVKGFLFSEKNFNDFNSLSDWIENWHLYATIAVAALLLRYIIGSAAHLRHTYIPKTIKETAEDGTITERKGPYSKDISSLFFDLLYLFVFGLLAIFITISTDNISDLMHASLYLLVAGAVWSVFGLGRPGQGWIARAWLEIDAVQIVLTLGIIFLPDVVPGVTEVFQAVLLSALFLVALFIDIKIVTAMVSEKPPKDA